MRGRTPPLPPPPRNPGGSGAPAAAEGTDGAGAAGIRSSHGLGTGGGPRRDTQAELLGRELARDPAAKARRPAAAALGRLRAAAADVLRESLGKPRREPAALEREPPSPVATPERASPAVSANERLYRSHTSISNSVRKGSGKRLEYDTLSTASTPASTSSSTATGGRRPARSPRRGPGQGRASPGPASPDSPGAAAGLPADILSKLRDLNSSVDEELARQQRRALGAAGSPGPVDGGAAGDEAVGENGVHWTPRAGTWMKVPRVESPPGGGGKEKGPSPRRRPAVPRDGPTASHLKSLERHRQKQQLAHTKRLLNIIQKKFMALPKRADGTVSKKRLIHQLKRSPDLPRMFQKNWNLKFSAPNILDVVFLELIHTGDAWVHWEEFREIFDWYSSETDIPHHYERFLAEVKLKVLREAARLERERKEAQRLAAAELESSLAREAELAADAFDDEEAATPEEEEEGPGAGFAATARAAGLVRALGNGRGGPGKPELGMVAEVIQRPVAASNFLFDKTPPKADGEGDDRGREVLYNELGFLELEKYIESEVQEMSTGSADGADGAVSREPRVARTAPPILALPGGSAGAEKKDVSLWDLFNAFDTNGDGQIDRSEMVELAHAFMPTITDLEVRQLLEHMNTLDADGNGMLSFDEVRNGLRHADILIDSSLQERIKSPRKDPADRSGGNHHPFPLETGNGMLPADVSESVGSIDSTWGPSANSVGSMEVAEEAAGALNSLSPTQLLTRKQQLEQELQMLEDRLEADARDPGPPVAVGAPSFVESEIHAAEPQAPAAAPEKHEPQAAPQHKAAVPALVRIVDQAVADTAGAGDGLDHKAHIMDNMDVYFGSPSPAPPAPAPAVGDDPKPAKKKRFRPKKLWKKLTGAAKK